MVSGRWLARTLLVTFFFGLGFAFDSRREVVVAFKHEFGSALGIHPKERNTILNLLRSVGEVFLLFSSSQNLLGVEGHLARIKRTVNRVPIPLLRISRPVECAVQLNGTPARAYAHKGCNASVALEGYVCRGWLGNPRGYDLFHLCYSQYVLLCLRCSQIVVQLRVNIQAPMPWLRGALSLVISGTVFGRHRLIGLSTTSQGAPLAVVCSLDFEGTYVPWDMYGSLS